MTTTKTTQMLPTRITPARRVELATLIADLAGERTKLRAIIEQAKAGLRKADAAEARLSVARESGIEICEVEIRESLEGDELVTYRHDEAHLWPDDVRGFGEIARRPATAEELRAARQPELPFAAPEGGQGSGEGPGEVAQGDIGADGGPCRATAPIEPWLGCTLPLGHAGPDHVAMAAPAVGPWYEAARWPVAEPEKPQGSVEGEGKATYTKAAIATGEAIAAGLASGIERAQDDDPVRRANLIEQGRALWASVGVHVERTGEASKGEERGDLPGDEPSSLDASEGLYFCKDFSCPRYRKPTDDIRCKSCGRTTEIREPTPAELAAIEAAPEEPVPAGPQAELDKLIEEQTRDATKGKKPRAKSEKAARKGGGR